MTQCCTDILKEIPCPVEGQGPIWFQCAYGGGCHAGVGDVLLKAQDGTILYKGNPTGGTSKKIYISFDPAKLNALGGTMDVDYTCCGHYCSAATFNWGYNGSETIVGTAYMDNTGGPNDKGGNGYARLNHFIIPIGAVPIAVVTPTVSDKRTVCYEVSQSCAPCSNQQPTGIWSPAVSSKCGTFTQYDYGTDPGCTPYSRVATGTCPNCVPDAYGNQICIQSMP